MSSENLPAERAVEPKAERLKGEQPLSALPVIELRGDDLRRPRAFSSAALVGWGLLGLMVIAGGALLAYLLPKPAAVPPPSPPIAIDMPVTRPPRVAPTREQAAARSRAALLAAIERGVVKLVAGSGANARGLGSGFLWQKADLVATSYHVIADATTASAVLVDGTTVPVTGYWAVWPDADLAILQLAGEPLRGEPLRATEAETVEPLLPVVAVGHPQGVGFSPFDGKVSRLLATSELGAASKRFVREQLGPASDHRWIQHTARLAPGNSGGPLLDEQGRVLGINTWFDEESSFGYALDASYLTELVAKPLPKVAPLARYARTSAREQAWQEDVTAAGLAQLYGDAEAIGFVPRNAEDYDRLARLARALTLVLAPGLRGRGGQQPTIGDDAVRTADQLVLRLGKRRWDPLGQALAINEFAGPLVSRPRSGVFLFGTVERVVASEDGARAMLVEVEGLSSRLLIPLENQLEEPPLGKECLIVGMNYQGQTIRYGENPLALRTAHLIASRIVLPLP